MIDNNSALPFPDRRSTAPPSHSFGVRESRCRFTLSLVRRLGTWTR